MLLSDTGKKLEKAFTQEQFDALVEVLENRQDRIAGKDDLRETELRLQLEIEKVRADIAKVRSETENLRAQMETVRADLTRDIETTKAELKRDIETTRAELKADIARLRLDTARDLREMEMRMLLKLGGLICASAGLIVALQKIFL